MNGFELAGRPMKVGHVTENAGGGNYVQIKDGLDSEELKSLVDLSGHKLSDSHQGMLKGILDLENITIEDIMIPRNEVHGLDLEDPIESLTASILDSASGSTPNLEAMASAVLKPTP